MEESKNLEILTGAVEGGLQQETPTAGGIVESKVKSMVVGAAVGATAVVSGIAAYKLIKWGVKKIKGEDNPYRNYNVNDQHCNMKK